MPANQQLADIFTMTLSKAPFLTNQLKLGVVHNHAHLLVRGSYKAINETEGNDTTKL